MRSEKLLQDFTLPRAFIRADIPLNKLNCDAFRQFLEKYTGKKTPNESTLRKTYLPDAFNDIMKCIALELKGKYFNIVVDETTDSGGCYIANLLIGELNPNSTTKPFLVASQELEKTNHTTVARFINDNLKRLFGEYRFEDKLLLMTSDAAPYMDAASVTKVKALLSETAIVKELAFIKSYIEFLPDIMEALETRGMTLKDQLEKLSFVEEKLKILPGKKGKVLQQKFENVFGNNSGLKQMKNFEIGSIPSDMDPFRLSCYTYAPITSVEVERSFSVFKNLLDNRRHSFVDKNSFNCAKSSFVTCVKDAIPSTLFANSDRSPFIPLNCIMAIALIDIGNIA
ncbi:hypothetical protein ILUMI_11351 [Ignelater luminosus]|uniref:Uncharacterized protein n=1 Tax=Ignelater luminosus TaxID=2038154 RepID=A0A8K0D1L4_IGNLU|nr:hypothetical protein ILUMI_11351 [Ignelater luminosus]